MTAKRISLSIAAALTIVVSAAFPAEAHIEGVARGGGLLAGFVHPLGGLDHVLAMVAVGLWAAHLGGRARWLVPASFLAMTGAGGWAAVHGLTLPFLETGIVLSVMVFGGLISMRARLPVAIGMALVGGFAMFHGAAHGLEIPVATTATAFGAGFLTATGLLHGLGLGLGLALTRNRAGLPLAAARLGGGAVVAAGLALVVL